MVVILLYSLIYWYAGKFERDNLTATGTNFHQGQLIGGVKSGIAFLVKVSLNKQKLN